MTIRVTEIQIEPIKPQGGIIGFASCVINDQFYIGDIAIATKLSGGFRLIYPTKKYLGKSFSILHPINKSVGVALEQAIIEKLIELNKKNS